MYLLFYKQFCEEFECKYFKYHKSLINTSVCSLHVVHNALQHGHRQTDWALQDILRAMYLLWKGAPARRADYINFASEFPRKFCQTRWLENQSSSERAISNFDNVKTFCLQMRPKPIIQSFSVVRRATQDKSNWSKA